MQINNHHLLWITKNKYIVNDVVLALSELWICQQDHESNTFAADKLDGKWSIYLETDNHA